MERCEASGGACDGLTMKAVANHSLKWTRYGKRRKPGLRHMVHQISPGLLRLPPQIGELER